MWLSKKYALALCALMAAAGCAPLPSTVAASPSQAQAVHPLAGKIGESIALQGTYQGWAQCELSSGATRSDWVLAYELEKTTHCVVVSGGVPQGIISAPSTASNGMPVWVKGKVALSTTNKPYIVLE